MSSRPAWKRILPIVVWLFAFTPVGLWKLWVDPELSATAKWRVLLYLFLIPVLVYLAVSLRAANQMLARWVP